MAETCILIITDPESDSDGFAVPEPKEIQEIEAYVIREKSVRHQEYYEAYASGLDARLIIELRIEEWEKSAHMVGDVKEYATKVRYDGSTYDVARSFKKNKSTVEITLASGKKVTSWR